MKFLKITIAGQENLVNLMLVKTIIKRIDNGRCSLIITFSDNSEPCEYQFENYEEGRFILNYVDL